MLKRIALVMALLTMSAAGFAQTATMGNAFVGYAFNRASSGWSNTGNLNGWEASVEGKIAPFTSIVADVGTQYGTLPLPVTYVFGGPGTIDATTRVVSYLAGLRVSAPVGRFRPFAHALAGIGHLHESAADYDHGETCVANAFGGGVDTSLTKLLAWRVQADVLQTRFHNGGQEDIRVSTGLVVKF